MNYVRYARCDGGIWSTSGNVINEPIRWPSTYSAYAYANVRHSFEADKGVTGKKPSGVKPVNPYSYKLSGSSADESEPPAMFSSLTASGTWQVGMAGVKRGTASYYSNPGLLAAGVTDPLRPGEQLPGTLYVPPIGIDLGSPDHDQMEAYNDAAGKGFDALTNLGELPETVEMFIKAGRTITSIWRSAVKVARGNPRGTQELKKLLNTPIGTMANNWLAARYGIVPLVGTVSDFRSYLNSDQGGATVRGSKQRSDLVVNRSQSQFVHGVHLGHRLIGEGIRTESISTRRRCFFGLKNQWQSTSGLVINPVTTAWELTTLSFVIDWFVSIGTQLEYASYYHTTSPLWGGIVSTVKRTIELAYSERYIRVPGEYDGWTFTTSNGSHRLTYESVGYSRISAVNPTPYQAPTVYMRLNASKIVDLVTLMKQRLPTKGRFRV